MHPFVENITKRILALRPRLMDTSRRNALINNSLSARSASFIRIVDEKPQSIFDILVKSGKSLKLAPLPPLEAEPSDENNNEFREAFSVACQMDEDYLAIIDTIDSDNDESSFEKQASAERQLKDQVRELLGYAPRIITSDATTLASHARNFDINPSFNLPEPTFTAQDDRHEDDELQTLLLPKKLNASLARIKSRDTTMSEEKGLNTLYLSLGYLRWSDPASSDPSNSFKSPLILIPIRLDQQRSLTGIDYLVSLRDDPIINPVLKHKLLTELGAELFEPEESTTELDVERYFTQMLLGQPTEMGWRIERQAVIGVFPFQGIELYNDLDPENIDFSAFDTLSHLFSGTDSGGNDPKLSPFTEDDIESPEAEALVPRIVMDADSSQYLSLIKAASGQNMAIEGPPGSGKSQTIVNLIANAIHNNKKVLFVAQKGTALDVVLSRLSSLNLDSMVLPLMGRKGDSVEFYDSLKNRLDLTQKHNKAIDSSVDIKNNFDDKKANIERYIRCLETKVYPTSMTVHQVLGLSISHEKFVDELPRELKEPSINLEKLGTALNLQLLDNASEWGKSWSAQFEASKVPEDSIWGILDVNNQDILLLEKIEGLSGQISKDFEKIDKTFGAGFQGNSSDYVFPLTDSKTSSTIESINSLRESDLDWKAIFSKIDEVFNAVTHLNECLETRNSLSEQRGAEWEVLLYLASHQDTLNDLISISQNLLSKEVSYNQIKDLKDEVKVIEGHYQRILSSFEQLNSQFGFEISPRKAKLLATLAREHPIIRNQGITAEISRHGFESVTSIIEKAQQLTEDSLEAISVLQDSWTGESNGESEPLAKLPSLKRLGHINAVLTNSGVFSIFSSEYRSCRRQAMEMLNIKRFSKASVLNCLSELVGNYKAWDSSPVIEIIGPFNKSNLQKDIASIGSLVDSLIATVRKIIPKHSDEARSFEAIVSQDIISFFDDLKNSYQNIDYDTTKDQLVKASNSKKEQALDLERLLASAETLIKTITENSLSNIANLTRIAQELPSVLNLEHQVKQLKTELEGFVTTNSNENLESIAKDLLAVLAVYVNADDDFKNIVKDASSAEDKLEVLSKFMSVLDILKQKVTDLYQGCQEYGVNHVLPEDLKRLHKVIVATILEQNGPTKIIQKAVVRNEIDRRGLLRTVDSLIADSTNLSLENHLPAVLVKYLSRKVYEKHSSILSEFSGQRINALRAEFKRLDRQLIKSATAELLTNAIKAARPPAGVGRGKKSEYSDMSLITHQLDLKRRIAPSRLVKRSIGALLEVHPCWMMVPTSVASYLPRKELFDLVIIDEASQMTPEHSISALMRAKQAVIVGDTNQLPPTNFFKSSNNYDDEEDEDTSTVEESILELANSAFRPKHRLLWHYRSRHEALIAFSNNYIYDNELVIFPSPGGAPEKMGVSLVRVNGIYQSGLNPMEASAVVDAVIEFMEIDSDRSLGVVTMNQSQMEQIESSILRQSENNKIVRDYIEKWASKEEGLQKFFVKNIENVQGDERDVIFISTVYGSDSLGKFRQGLGPINGAAGKRRLNVLFSRAKEKITTFTSIPLDRLNPGDHNEGAILLKRWLEYSANGTLGESLKKSSRAMFGPDSPFEEHVIERIESIGYQAVPQVGVSNYFIDVGVRHPDFDLGYICGVECDGASYHSSKSARDRDILRQEVLERLGWDIYRIWSTDWFRDAYGQTQRLKAYLDKKLAEKIEKYGHSPEEVIIDQYAEPAIEEHSKDTSQEPKKAVIKLGSKICIEYSDGPRAGMRSKFVVVDSMNQESKDGFDLLPSNSPIGSQLLGESVGETVTYEAGGKLIDVEIIEIIE
jgi:very-short-patch-repair endonuclease